MNDIVKKRVLLVEDDKDFSRLLTRKLESNGYEVESASDGNEGLRKAVTGNADLVLLDVMLPGMDGLELLQRLRKDERGNDVPVVILSNLAFHERLPEAQGLYQDYVIKAEVGISDIMDMVERFTRDKKR